MAEYIAIPIGLLQIHGQGLEYAYQNLLLSRLRRPTAQIPRPSYVSEYCNFYKETDLTKIKVLYICKSTKDLSVQLIRINLQKWSS